MKIQPLLKETARDLLAFGSIPMFIIIAVRTTLADNYKLLAELILAAVIIFILSLIFRQQKHIALSIPLYIFTILFYQDNRFTIFASILILLLIASLFYLKYPKKQIILGALSGLISSGISYFVFNNLITGLKNF